MRKKRNYWDKEKCYCEALKYTTRKLFSLNSSTAYEVLRRNGWLDDACLHMKRPYESKFKWSKEKCLNIALKYMHRKEFQNGDKNAYYAAMYNGWLNEICQHMKYKKLPNAYWQNIENCKNEALKYSTKSEFIKNSQYVYYISLKNGWLDKICQHMIRIGDRYNKCIYSYEFSDNHVYVGLTYNMKVREKSRNKNKYDSVIIHQNKTGLMPILKQLTDYIFVEDAIKMEEKYLNDYISNGWIPLNKRKTGGIGSTTPVWNVNRVKKIASNYGNIAEFMSNESELYDIAKRSGWLYSFFPNEI